MKTMQGILAAGLLVAGALGAANMAQARTYWSVGVGVPGVAVGVAPAAYPYYYPQPVYVQPPIYDYGYWPAPAYVSPYYYSGYYGYYGGYYGRARYYGRPGYRAYRPAARAYRHR